MSGGQDEAAEMIDDGGPILPREVAVMRSGINDYGEHGTIIEVGLSVRDLFALEAMKILLHHRLENGARFIYAESATEVYSLADAMIQQRKAKPCTKAQ